MESWRQKAAVFDDKAQEYDAWFEESLLFEIELTALRELTTCLDTPKIEIGVGPGRFAEALGVAYGLDPAWAPLTLASRRGIGVAQAIGEELPLAKGAASTIFLLFTLCFLADPPRVLAECGRVLRPGGHLVLGMVPAQGAWGRELAEKKRKGHPFYRHAAFYTKSQVESWLRAAGFHLVEERSSLYQPPKRLQKMEHSRPSGDEEAGFCLLVGKKEG